MATPAWLRYANQGATRNQPISPQLLNAFNSFLPELGVTMEVFSGGQPAKGSGGARVGSVRHDHGNAADVFFEKGGRRLDWANPDDLPIFQEIVSRGKQAGITGFGAGPGYMQPGSMHVGFGSPGVWGAGGRGANAPDWLRKAYGSQPSIGTQIAAQEPSPPQASGTPAPALPDPISVASAPATPMQSSPPPPPGILAALTGGSASSTDKMSGILSMLGTSMDQPQQQPMQLQPMQRQANVPSLADYISQFMSGRTA
ncbi:hypothetical protein [Brucella intermedia]|uniref:hypothetical protein n=1 Tax=Brucella intermedia TaxID=94625 RepID=UPI0023609EE9|nr:hypothetical protein [Brucella intermedia]